MHRRTIFAVLLGSSLTYAAACVTPDQSTGTQLSATRANLEVGPGPANQHVAILDACDPATFNAAVGPNTCIKNGGTTFQQFVAELTAKKRAEGWHFAPTTVNLKLGDSFTALNLGGEVHTFTEVDAFGGGRLEFLNKLSGNTTEAPECKALQSGDFLAPGQTFHDTPSAKGTELYQCCIHPWMRAVVQIH